MEIVRIERQKCCGKSIAFTLAEVLITLGIIGVVSAMTISTLVKGYQHKVLEVKFKRTLSIMQNAMVMTKSELGVEELGSYCSNHLHASECELAFINKFIKLSSPKCRSNGARCTPYSVYRNPTDISTYNGKNSTHTDSCLRQLYYTNALPDNSFIGAAVCGVSLNIAIDINGYQKPNKLGHDVFLFNLAKNGNITYRGNVPDNSITDEQAEAYYENYTGGDKDYYVNMYGNQCSLTSQRKGNGAGCTYYALRNECPTDSTKTYWECLP